MPVQEYLKKAQACLTASGTMGDGQERAVMLHIAKAYMKLAEYVIARLDRVPPIPPTAIKDDRPDS
jgi:hypothetical protein